MPSVRTAVTRTLRLAAWGRAAVLLGLAAVAVLALANSRDELLAAVQGLGRVAAPWVAVAVALEALSYTAYAAGQRLLLRRAGAPDLGLGVLTTTAVVAQAASNCLPGGVAVTGLVSHRQFTRRGVPPLLAGWVLVLTSGLYLTALALMSLVAAELTGGTGPVPGLQATSLGLALVLLVAGVALGVLRRRWDLPTLEAALRSRLPGRRSAGGWSRLGHAADVVPDRGRLAGRRLRVDAGLVAHRRRGAGGRLPRPGDDATVDRVAAGLLRRAAGGLAAGDAGRPRCRGGQPDPGAGGLRRCAAVDAHRRAALPAGELLGADRRRVAGLAGAAAPDRPRLRRRRAAASRPRRSPGEPPPRPAAGRHGAAARRLLRPARRQLGDQRRLGLRHRAARGPGAGRPGPGAGLGARAARPAGRRHPGPAGRARLPPTPTSPAPPPPSRSEPADAPPRTCAIVYRGPFPAAALAEALPGSSGDYAVVLLRVRHPESHTLVLVPVVPAPLRRT